MISRHPVSGNILVNDVPTAGANAATIKKVAVTTTGAGTTIIIDFANGSFAPGTSTSPGITVTGSGAAYAFKLRGASGSDLITCGENGTTMDEIGFNSDAFPDITFPGFGVVTFTFSLGSGDDVFGADLASAHKYLGATAVAQSDPVTVYGGPGNDTFEGGLGDDFFYGDTGNDTFKGGPAGGTWSKTFIGGTDASGTDQDVADFSLRPASEGPLFFTVDGDPVLLTGTPSGCLTAGCGAIDEQDVIATDVEVVKGGAGPDTYVVTATQALGHSFLGGAGSDTVDYRAMAAAVSATMGDKTANDGPAAWTKKDNIGDDVENVVCRAADACTVVGNTLDNTFFVLAGTSAAHSFSGGTGLDTVDFTAFGATLDVKMDNTASTTAGIKINTDVENLKCPTLNTASCTVAGNDLGNHLWGVNTGGAGVNTLSGGNGDDTIEGVETGDTVDCGSGSDLFFSASLARPASCEL
ncbi:MAG: hypothetical protein QM765_28520 [Myxococcales bacterium]